jgi:myo-inositol-1(or 4)-monophosphatase
MHRALRGDEADDLAFALTLAQEAGRVVMERYERLERIRHKSAKDVVTEADHLSEELMIRAIRSRYPGDGILAEESGRHDAARPGHATDGSGRTWILDPLDGTVNYANGIPFFCISVALAVEGHPSVGVIHDPTRHETFAATAHGPATLNGRRVATSEKKRLADAVVALALSGRSVTARVRAVRRAVRVSRSMGSSALSLAYVANGRFDAFAQSSGQSSWDVAAAGLIAGRAGARVTDLMGRPWFDIGRANQAWGVLAAPPALHGPLLELVAEPPAAGRPGGGARDAASARDAARARDAASADDAAVAGRSASAADSPGRPAAKSAGHPAG